MQAISPWDDVAFSSTEGDRHLGIRPVSQLNTWPVVSPVNASRRPSRDAAHRERTAEIGLRPGPVERDARTGPFLQRRPIGLDRLLKPHRAALARAKRLERSGEIGLRPGPVERDARAG